MTHFSNVTSKVRPATRGLVPDDPMNRHAVQVPGDPEVMLQVLVEEFACTGWTLDAIRELAWDPFDEILHGLWEHYGDDEFCRRVREILSHCSVMRTIHCETPAEDELVLLGEE